MKRNKHKSERGMVLVTVIIFGAIIILLGTAMLSTGVMEVKSGNHYQNDTQAYYVAKAGADIVAKKIMAGPIMFIDDEVKIYNGKIDDQNIYEVTVKKIGNEIKIDSKGSSNGVKNKVQLSLKENVVDNSKGYILETDMVLFAKNSIYVSSGTINGNIGTNANTKDAITITKSGDIVLGPIYLRKGTDLNKVIKNEESKRVLNIGYLTKEIVYPSPKLPEVPNGSSSENLNISWWPVVSELDLSQSDIYYYNEFNFAAPDLSINVGNRNVKLVVNKFTMQGSNNIKISGTGSLSLFIKDTFDMGGSTKLNWDDSSNNENKLKIYYYNNSRPVVFTGGIKFCGIFQTDLAPITITSGNSDIFRGTLISGTSGKIDISGGSHAYTNVLYAPNAVIDIHSGGHFKGSIIGSSVSLSGGSSIIFSNPGKVTIPIEVGAGGGTSATYEKLHYE